MIRSEEKEFSIDGFGNFLSLEKVCSHAYKMALAIHQIDNSGNCKDDRFPRSTSSMKVKFDGFTLTGDMGGGESEYHFKTWIECDDEEDEE